MVQKKSLILYGPPLILLFGFFAILVLFFGVVVFNSSPLSGYLLSIEENPLSISDLVINVTSIDFVNASFFEIHLINLINNETADSITTEISKTDYQAILHFYENVGVNFDGHPIFLRYNEVIFKTLLSRFIY